ncbi:hypothetical protein BRE01_60250 [Brevibacillus reuszeri]|uniref:Uncharacterized protein n=1 Tax=Brevibacillus reuszeri TaxID=54915 RepID=A0A0K9YNJ5_9BACL|nr:hypothetical protein [Brevibacillus reuszeri]KNB70227.1 hypothetical protein ADS79_14765 [Brevibacillus reuszeri]MED1859182.1 hypothetical protein [Brevibacillus reuszeri]GED72323.1 hypothetical protein BRE01_60250 [Brevibacillus reuszeri]
MDSNGGMTTEEKEIADHIVAAWNGFVTLKPTHPNDQVEFGDAIHRLQHLLGMRVLRRDYPDYWLTKTK